jgi:vacuolar-type H+-ATPase subunit D/Vma8
MDRKRSILVREMMQTIDRAAEIRRRADETFAAAYEALQNAHITLGVCRESAMTIPVETRWRWTTARSWRGTAARAPNRARTRTLLRA